MWLDRYCGPSAGVESVWFILVPAPAEAYLTSLYAFETTRRRHYARLKRNMLDPYESLPLSFDRLTYG